MCLFSSLENRPTVWAVAWVMGQCSKVSSGSMGDCSIEYPHFFFLYKDYMSFGVSPLFWTTNPQGLKTHPIRFAHETRSLSKRMSTNSTQKGNGIFTLWYRYFSEYKSILSNIN